MGSLFSKPKAPEPFRPSEEQKQLERNQLESRREQESEMAKRAAKSQSKGYGRRSLLTGAATGVEEKSTKLGA